MGSKCKTGVPLNAQSREIIYNVHDYFTREALRFKLSHNRHFNAVQKRCTEALGISKTSLNRLISEKFQYTPGSKPQRIRKIRGPKGKSHSRFCDIVKNVFVYLSKEWNEFKSIEDGYFENVEDRVIDATGICRSLLLQVLNEKENGISKLDSSKQSAKMDSPKKKCDVDICEAVDVSPIEISSSESDSELESVLDYVLA